MNNTTIFLVLGLAALGGGAFFIIRRQGQQGQQRFPQQQLQIQPFPAAQQRTKQSFQSMQRRVPAPPKGGPSLSSIAQNTVANVAGTFCGTPCRVLSKPVSKLAFKGAKSLVKNLWKGFF